MAGKLKTTIIYCLTASIATIKSDVTEARESGKPVRLIAIEEFRGETEQNAGAVYVERSEGDELVFDRIQQAYPLIVVQDYGGSVDFDKKEATVAVNADEDLKALRLELIRLGGSAPAGADAAQLADLIAAQRAHVQHVPILPNPATQGTTVPDPTPIVQKNDGDKLIDDRATGTSAKAKEVVEEVAGEAPTGTQSAAASQSKVVEEDVKSDAKADDKKAAEAKKTDAKAKS